MKISRIRIERLFARFRKIWADVRGTSGQLYVWDRVDEYHSMWQAVARNLGAEMTSLADDIWEISLNNKRTRVLNDKLEYDNPVTLVMAGRKHLVYELLGNGGLRVPEYSLFRLDDLSKAQAFLREHPRGCVIKPADGTCSGQGVTTHIQTEKEIRQAAILASLYCPDIIIEPMIAGECYRLLVLNGEVIHAVCRRGERLRGDGKLTVAELIKAEKNALEIDKDCEFNLDYQGLSLESVPEEGQHFLVKSVTETDRKQVEVRTIYNMDVTDTVGDSLKQEAVRAAEILGCSFVGVDFITVNAALSLEESGGYINELNTTPGLHHHYGYKEEEYSEVALRVISPLLQKGSR